MNTPIRENKIRLLCVDDNQMVAEALEGHLATLPRYEWVGWVSHSSELIDHATRTRPDVILLDIDMPGPDAFGLVQELAACCPDSRVLMFSAYVRRDYIDRAIDAGAWGYVSKNDSMAEVLRAIDQAAGGEFVLSNDVLQEQRLR